MINYKQLNSLFIEYDIDAYRPLEVYKEILEKNNIEFVRDKTFLKVRYNDKALPEYGWKIHVSAVPENAEIILDLVSKYCHENQITFKVMLDPEVLARSLSKSAKRSSSGKFITIYPLSEAIFVHTISELGQILKNYEGPYILSDKRYQNCKVLYYRYGRINVRKKKFINNKWSYVIEGPDKEIYIDDPMPRYRQPSWIIDPLDPIKTEENEKFCNGKYTISDVKHMSNSGGVYLARKESTQENIILKEARPSLAVLKNGVDAIDLRKNEVRILELLKDCPAVPKLVDYFYEWEHFFIGVEFIDGKTFHDIITSPAFIDNKISNPELNLEKGIPIFIAVLKALQCIHHYDVTIGDISGYNIMITPSGQAKFIDFESATNSEIAFNASYYMETRGYRYHKLKEDLSNRFEIDIEGIGLLFLSYFHNTGSFYSLASENVDKILYGLLIDRIITEKIYTLLKTMIFHPEKFRFDLAIKDLSNYQLKLDDIRISNLNTASIKNNIRTTLKETYKSLLSNAYLGISERLFQFVNQEKQLSLFRGSLGTFLTIEKLEHTLLLKSNKTDQIAYKINQILNEAPIMNPSFFDGLAGIALGTHKSQRLKKKDIPSNVNVPKLNLYEGICGVGFAQLKIYQIEKDPIILNKAILIGKTVIELLNKLSTLQINNQELGFFNGLSGVSYFLLELYEETQDRIFLENATKILDICLESAVKINNSIYIPFSLKEPKYYTGFLGNGGVALSMAKMIQLHPSEEHLFLLESLVKPLLNPYITGISYGNGLAGNLKILLELTNYSFISIEKESLAKLASTLLRFAFVFQKQTYFPNANFNMLDLSYYNGMCGVIDTLIDYYCEMSI